MSKCKQVEYDLHFCRKKKMIIVNVQNCNSVCNISDHVDCFRCNTYIIPKDDIENE